MWIHPLQSILSECVSPIIVSAKKENGTEMLSGYVSEIFSVIEEGMTYQSHQNWDTILNLLGHCYKVIFTSVASVFIMFQA